MYRSTTSYTYSDTYTLSLASYARDILEGDFDVSVKTLVADLVAYILEAFRTYNMEGYEGYDALAGLSELVDLYGSCDVTLPESQADTSMLTEAIRSAQLYLDYGTKLRFNIKADFTGAVAITVGGETLEYTVENGLCGENAYIELDIPAYMLTELITITAGEASGVYDIAAYCAALDGTQHEDLALALYTYALSAKASLESAE